MTSELVSCTVDDGIAVVTLNDPPMNLTTRELTRQLHGVVSRLAADDEVRVVVVTGAGDTAFNAGSDIKEFPALIDAGDVVERKTAFENETFGLLAALDKPTIAALNGLAYGGGLELAVCCDVIVADAGVTVSLPEVKLGVIPSSGGPVRVARRIGPARTKGMMFFGDPVSVETASEWGLVNRVVARGEALSTAREMARRLTRLPATALGLCKQAVEYAADHDEQESIRALLALSERAFATEDAREGVRAFLAKDTPRFTHDRARSEE
ncbi:enoyl-CoA hydratase/carnithine racemase [Saccharopolyspora lacisalsi]|uniref:Enoyl-CoA hydratase/carnithine racemase n=1 Tax=Halosaccharopolyspora lacisalsi TaxID=1000566 RepID=A0A839DXY0_9PSEU|nr:enoyl-CoA hydratase-related protein [Halosaccharopolyspora lacisalsi]MBA8826344.1 enoyl-CoA hydratase/carnithine racemase [Halosaccharopolyspora lacisalsi]